MPLPANQSLGLSEDEYLQLLDAALNRVDVFCRDNDFLHAREALDEFVLEIIKKHIDTLRPMLGEVLDAHSALNLVANRLEAMRINPREYGG